MDKKPTNIETKNFLRGASLIYFTLPELTEFVKQIKPLLQTAIGALLVLFGQQYSSWRSQKKDSVAVSILIAAELESIMALIRAHNYIGSLQNSAEAAKAGKLSPFSINVTRAYTKVYDSNLAKIGQLEKNSVLQIVRFYAILNSCLEDLDQIKEIQKDMTSATVDDWKNLALGYLSLKKKLEILLLTGDDAVLNVYMKNISTFERIRGWAISKFRQKGPSKVADP